MRNRSICGASRRKTIITTIRDRDAKPARDLVERRFTADGPNELWAADITYVPTWSGFLYLAVVLDVFSRRVVGWAMADHMREGLAIGALDMAIFRRKPLAVVHHFRSRFAIRFHNFRDECPHGFFALRLQQRSDRLRHRSNTPREKRSHHPIYRVPPNGLDKKYLRRKPAERFDFLTTTLLERNCHGADELPVVFDKPACRFNRTRWAFEVLLVALTGVEPVSQP